VIRARLVVFLCALAIFALPSAAFAQTTSDVLVSDVARQAIFQIDVSTGDRTVISGCIAFIGGNCSSTIGGGTAIVAPSGMSLGTNAFADSPFYVTDTFTDTLMQIDPTTGFRTAVSSPTIGAGTGFVSPVDVSVRANGNLIVVDEGLVALVEVDPVTGNRTIISSSAVGTGTAFSQPHDVAIDASGQILVLDTVQDAIFRVDPGTGDRTILSSLGQGSGPSFVDPQNITLDAVGNILVSDANAHATLPGAIYSVDPITGNRVIISSDAVGTGRDLEVPVGMALDNVGNILALDFAPGLLLSINALTGDRIVLSSSQMGSGLSLSGPTSILALPTAIIPEPSTALLLGLGMALLARRDRREPPGRRRP
jgi:outer membrane protein assembly factor BamB